MDYLINPTQHKGMQNEKEKGEDGRRNYGTRGGG